MRAAAARPLEPGEVDHKALGQTRHRLAQPGPGCQLRLAAGGMRNSGGRRELDRSRSARALVGRVSCAASRPRRRTARSGWAGPSRAGRRRRSRRAGRTRHDPATSCDRLLAETELNSGSENRSRHAARSPSTGGAAVRANRLQSGCAGGAPGRWRPGPGRCRSLEAASARDPGGRHQQGRAPSRILRS